jgi:hypothetical protein
VHSWHQVKEKPSGNGGTTRLQNITSRDDDRVGLPEQHKKPATLRATNRIEAMIAFIITPLKMNRQ